MAYTKPSFWNASPAQHKLISVNLKEGTDWSVDPIILLENATGITAVDAIALISTITLTDGTNPLTFTVELHSANIMDPVTADTKLLNNMMAAPLTGVTADTYKAADLLQHSFMPLIAIAPKAANSPSLQADITSGNTIYDVVLRSNAKPAQTTGVLYIRVLYYQYLDGNFTPGTEGSCCTVGYTPATN